MSIYNNIEMLRLSSNHLTKVQDLVSSIFCPHEMRIDSASLNYRQQVFRLGEVSLSTISYGDSVELQPEPFPNFYLLQVPLSGYDQQRTGKQQVTSDVCIATMHSPSEQVAMSWSSNCKKFVVRFEQDAFESQADYVLGRALGRSLSFSREIRTDNVVFCSWLNMATHIYRQLDKSPRLLHNSLLISQFQQVLMGMLFSLESSEEEHIQTTQYPRVLPAYVRRTVDFIQANLESEVSIDQLSKIAGVSKRSLYDGFSRFLDASPMQYMKQLRMECLRRDLLDPKQPRSVTELATRLGFYQLGRLSGEYRQRYGENPSETLKRALS